MDILEKIIASKKLQVARFKPKSSIERFEKEGFFWNFSNRSLKNRLLEAGSNGIIAEFKRRSPSKGWFQQKELEVEPVVKAYNIEAAGISVLTEEEHFGGDLDDLIQTKVITELPILRKDFIVDRWQIAESKAFGADVILLIASALSAQEVKDLSSYAKSIGLEVLLEIHNEEEIGHICDTVDMVGVNNRNLKTFETNIATSLTLISKIPANFPAIAESGISNVQTIVTLMDAGFKGFLIGETFMSAADPAIAFANFISELNAIRHG
jgi:indole-3-glycerol phosphate synthase